MVHGVAAKFLIEKKRQNSQNVPLLPLQGRKKAKEINALHKHFGLVPMFKSHQ